MKEVIETLFQWNRCLLGEGYDNALEYLKTLIGLEIIEIPSQEKVGSWVVPNEWFVEDAWVKFNGEKIIDYKKQPLSLVVGSQRTNGIVKLDELKRHLHYNEDMPDATPYVFKHYDIDWGFCLPYNSVREKTTEEDTQPSGVVGFDGQPYKFKTKDKLPEGDYEVYIDAAHRPGKLKIGVHTIPGKSSREILLLAHLDHPYQANDNLSGVACLVDLATKLKSEHTIKIIFCAETIGSVAYTLTQDISKVDFVIAVDICGNKNSILLQKSFDPEDKINRVAHLALHKLGEDHRKGRFRNTIGSDEYAFNDPLIGIPGIMLSTWPYPEYHTSEDTPEKIDYEQIGKVQKVIQNIIEIYEKDFIPVRNFKGPLMRSRYGIQSLNKEVSLSWDYLIYAIDGKRSLAELCADYGINFDVALIIFERLENDQQISRVNPGKIKKQSPGSKKH